jgi:hypothetical protein
MLDELVQLVEIDVGEELAGEIADRQALAGGGVGEALVFGNPAQFRRAAAIDRLGLEILLEDDPRQPA